ncbi:ATPase, T2SS/T4P/T4SS family [Algisphaera agarilytica]|uniref:Flp pilus assembly CpaF family ATPase n=1 Tax=Algisphaera agarilytica TaxID=1385975 RepID=A0A7X0LIJ3_9BACT|nr:ATPase, T2SS/T4P/T4SS family [Algisphaera agarilytica]MBB6428265.1 Flp pilus assembly CpaF family ATPase [Algisphaera agarilytica]
MQFWLYDHSNNLRHTLEAEGDPIHIGRDDGCDIVLKSPFVAPRHARILRKGNRMVVEALSQAGTRVANREVQKGTPLYVDFGDEIQIGQFTIAMVGRNGDAVDSRTADDELLQARLMELEQEVHAELLERMNLRVTGSIRKDDSAFLNEVLFHLDEVLQSRINALDSDIIRLACRHHLERLVTAEVVRQCQGKVQTEYKSGDDRLLDPAQETKITELVTSLVDMMPLLFDPSSVSEDLAVAEDSFDELFDNEYPTLDHEVTRYIVQRTVAKDIQDIMLGLGPLQDLLEMPSVSEIMVVGKDRIYIEKNGIIQPTTRTFFSDDVLLSIIERILAPVGRRVDTSVPLVDARLADGSRVNVVIHPLSLVGPCLTIRKFGWVPFTMDDLVEREALSANVASFLQGCIIGRSNIVIAGGTGSGKTTLLNVLGAYARPNERIITVEESAELQLPQPHVVKLEGRPANIEGKGAYTIRELVRNSLRMRPDRIIVGEVRGPEAMDMLQAMNTGHDGSLSTVHANNPHDAMKRLEALVLMAVEMPIRAIREQIVTAVDLVVQVTRFASGHRRVTAISEVTSIDPETGQVRLEDIFTLKNPKQPTLRHTGYIPTFAEEMVERGDFDVDVFL